MRRVVLCMAVFCAAVFLFPRTSSAQDGGIAGVVKDTSGAVMPGVLVEASSPALIEKNAVGVTDSAGQYKIVDLRPGHLRGDVHARRVQDRAARQHHPRRQLHAARSTPNSRSARSKRR